MSKRVCAEPNCAELIEAGAYRGRCNPHARATDKRFAANAGRIYTWQHRVESMRLKAQVQAGEHVTCWRCGLPITDPSDLHLGHDDQDRSITRGAEHQRCNASAAGRNSHY